MKHFNYGAVALKSLRKSMGLSQAQLAKKIGVHTQFVSNWERSLCAPPTHCLKKLFKGQSFEVKKNYIDRVKADEISKINDQFKKLKFL